jgi:hypothetical protein
MAMALRDDHDAAGFGTLPARVMIRAKSAAC